MNQVAATFPASTYHLIYCIIHQQGSSMPHGANAIEV